MRKSRQADREYHHNYYMKHRQKYLARQLHWAHTHPEENSRRQRQTYLHKKQHAFHVAAAAANSKKEVKL